MYKLNDDIIIRETDNKALSLTTGDVIEMNETGLYIMLLCKDPISFDDIKVGLFRLNLINSIFLRNTVVGHLRYRQLCFFIIKLHQPCRAWVTACGG